MRVQRVVMPSGTESATVLADGLVLVPADRFLAHLTAIDRSPTPSAPMPTICGTTSTSCTAVACSGIELCWRIWAGS